MSEEVHTEWRVGTDLHDIWIFQRGFDCRRVAKITGVDEWEWVEIKPGEQRPEPSLTLPESVWRALSAKINGVLPPSEATERHLLDAIAVRDRLLDKVAPPR